jgi:hypothetical protein
MLIVEDDCAACACAKPSRPLAGRVDRVSVANADGVGGLRLLFRRRFTESRLFSARGAPHSRPLPATRFARGGRGETQRARGEVR